MSTEVVLFPPRATKLGLRKHLRSLGYLPVQHLWSWPKGSVHFHWFEEEDFKSTDGVEATIYPTSEEERNNYKAGAWTLHTRTRASASRFDKEYQNHTIRTARKMFGGDFYNDWRGKNRYVELWTETKSPAGRGIYLSYHWVLQNVRAVQRALPQPIEVPSHGPLAELTRLHDPVRVLYNALVPFAVAALEHFFSQTFIILLRFDDQARRRLRDQTRKVEMSEVFALSQGERRIEELVAQWYSFQNIQSVHNAFYEWFGIDVWKLLRRRKRVGRRISVLERRLNHLIEFRHGIVHRFELDFGLGRDEISELLESARVLIEVFVDHLEQERGIKIRDE
ncbi:MAG TPA: HEPN domain-containing protein [Longimicrobiaceae bacterium]|nr:HEPN domain-containing protein [Longimicrobiaceae bacterium]